MPYRRVPFELSGEAAPRQLSDGAGISWQAADDDETLLEVFSCVLEASIDPRDIASVRVAGSKALAVTLLERALSGGIYECERQWWSIVAVNGAAAGFVLPVVFTGCRRGSLDEGTIFHIGVVPDQRGHGLGGLLLGRGTDSLLGHGVWRICADTAAENSSMIRLFERQGWERGSVFEMGAHSG